SGSSAGLTARRWRARLGRRAPRVPPSLSKALRQPADARVPAIGRGAQASLSRLLGDEVVGAPLAVPGTRRGKPFLERDTGLEAEKLLGLRRVRHAVADVLVLPR